MCGRFTLTVPDAEAVAAAMGAWLPPELAEAYRVRFNIAPTDGHLVGRIKDGRLELAAAGIRANAVCPGMVYTPMTSWRLDQPQLREQGERIPLTIKSSDPAAGTVTVTVSW